MCAALSPNLYFGHPCHSIPACMDLNTPTLRTFLDTLPGGVFCCTVGLEQTFTFVSGHLLELLEYTPERFDTRFHGQLINLIAPEDYADVCAYFRHLKLPEESSDTNCSVRISTGDGAVKWFHLDAVLCCDQTGTPFYLCILVDISVSHSLLEAERLLVSCIRRLSSDADFDGIMNHVLQSILTYYGGNRGYVFEFDWTNRTTSNTYECCAPGVEAEIDNLKDLPIELVDPWVHAFEHNARSFVVDDVEALALDPMRIEEYHILHDQGIHSLVAVPIRYNGQLHGFLGVDDPVYHRTDVDFLVNLTYFICNEMDKRKLTQELRRLSFSDFMTQLNNRNAYNRVLEQNQTAPHRDVGVVFADLNGLKYANDTFGHEYGDRLIRHMADILLSHFDKQDIFRISGDEFVVICKECSSSQFQRRVAVLRTELLRQGEELASVGCCWESESSNLQRMIYTAEQKMYESKQIYHSKHSNVDQLHHVQMMELFLGHWIRERFLIYVQPRVRSSDSSLIALKALVRYQGEDGRISLPFEFLPIMEQERLTLGLDLLVFDQMCQAVVRWKNAGYTVPPVAVSCSRASLIQDNFVQSYVKIAAKYGILPDSVTIEVTESRFLIVEYDTLNRVMTELHRHGFHIAVGYLGVESSSLSALAMESLGLMRLDMSLTHQLEQHPRIRILVQSLIELAHRLSLPCLAEGVETNTQAAILRSLDCDILQGYYFGHPMPLSAFERQYLQNRS